VIFRHWRPVLLNHVSCILPAPFDFKSATRNVNAMSQQITLIPIAKQEQGLGATFSDLDRTTVDFPLGTTTPGKTARAVFQGRMRVRFCLLFQWQVKIALAGLMGVCVFQQPANAGARGKTR